MENNIIWKNIIIDGNISNYEISNIGQVRNKLNGHIKIKDIFPYSYQLIKNQFIN